MYTKGGLFNIDNSLDGFPLDQYGRYSLKAFGLRLGGKEQKLEFNDWSHLSEEMVTYMEGDVEVSSKLIEFLLNRSTYPPQNVIDMEHDVAKILAAQEEMGFHFNLEKARVLNTSLLSEKLNIEMDLEKFYKPRFLAEGKVTTSNLIVRKLWYVDSHYVDKWVGLSKWIIPLNKFKSGKFKYPPKSKTKWHCVPKRIVPYTKQGQVQNIAYTAINMGSRHHVRSWINHLYGLTFLSFSEKGQPKVGYESIDELIEYVESNGHKQQDDVLFQLTKLRRYFKVIKDQSQLQSLIESVRPDSSITSRVDQLGTNTGRFTMSGGKDSEGKAKAVNLAQLPSQKEFRELFDQPKGFTFVGTDFSGAENVVLSEGLYTYGEGELDKIINDGDKDKGTDLHSLNAKVCGVSRGDGKALWFGKLYGSSETLTGYSILGSKPFTDYTDKEFEKTKKKLLKRAIDLEGVQYYPIKKGSIVPFTDQLVKQALFGKQVQDKLVKNTKGLAEFTKALQKEVKDTGGVKLFDGRVIEVGSSHKALNYYCQGNNAVAMKVYLLTIHEEFNKANLVVGRDLVQGAVIYDEVNLRVKDEHVETVRDIMQKAYATISRKLNMTVTFTGEVLVGSEVNLKDGLVHNNWWGCH